MNIYVSAYLDKNLGDDLMVRILAGVLKDHQLYLYCKDEKKYMPFKDISNMQRCEIPLNKINKKGTIHFHAYITIGGSIFILNDFKTIFKRYIKYLKKRTIKNKGLKIATIGCNLGPFKNNFAEKLAIKELKLSQLITVRDNKSYKLIAEDLSRDIYYYPDIVFSMDESFFTTEKDEYKHMLGISVYNSVREPMYNDGYIKAMAKIADEYIEKTGNKVKLLAFDTGNENDMKAAKAIFRSSNYKNKINIIGHCDDGTTLLNEMNECTSLIATRMHSIVLAYKLGIPFIPVIYSDKTRFLLDDMEYYGIKIEFKDANVVDFEKITAELIEIESQRPPRKYDAESASNGHFDRLLEFLNSKK